MSRPWAKSSREPIPCAFVARARGRSLLPRVVGEALGRRCFREVEPRVLGERRRELAQPVDRGQRFARLAGRGLGGGEAQAEVQAVGIEEDEALVDLGGLGPVARRLVLQASDREAILAGERPRPGPRRSWPKPWPWRRSRARPTPWPGPRGPGAAAGPQRSPARGARSRRADRRPAAWRGPLRRSVPRRRWKDAPLSPPRLRGRWRNRGRGSRGGRCPRSKRGRRGRPGCRWPKRCSPPSRGPCPGRGGRTASWRPTLRRAHR